MKERPILFNGPMVRAILAGTKTQTRRVVKPQFSQDAEPVEMGATNERGHQIAGHSGIWWCDVECNQEEAVRCPYGQPGDRLWVQETFAHVYRDNRKPAHRSPEDVSYAAIGLRLDRDVYGSWCPSIHMPRWASRILLEVADVRVERLQDIGEADAIAEGIERGEDFFGCPCWKAYGEPAGSDVVFPDDPIGSYASLWTSINGPGSWDANPWIWAIEFRRIAP